MKTDEKRWLKIKRNMKQIMVCFTLLLFCINATYSQSKNGVTVKRIGNKEIVIDASGNEIIGKNHPYQSIRENFPHDHFLWIQNNKKWAFFDVKGNPLTPFIFDELHPANICSYQPNLWFGEDLRWFYKGVSVVEKHNQFAVLNEKMEYVVPWGIYQWISPPSIGGLMIVKQNNKYGLLSHQLKLVEPIEFDTISNLPAKGHEQNYPSFWARKNNKYYIFDTLGYWSDKIEYENIELLNANFYLVAKDGERWRIDRNGIKIIEDFTVVRYDEIGFVAKKQAKYGLIAIDGEIILPFEYDDIICEHLGNIFVRKNEKWGMVDEENKQLLETKFDYIAYAWDENNENRRNYIVVQGDRFGKVTEKGDEIFSCLYDGITTWVEYGPDGHYVMISDRMGLIDYNGEILIPVQYDKINCFHGTNLALVYDKGKIGLFNLESKSFLLPLEYDYLHINRDLFGFEKNNATRIITSKNGTIDILDEKGKIVRTEVSNSEIKKEFEIDVDAYHYSPCSYELLLMIHNRTFQIPDCLLKSYKEHNASIESIYWKMGKNE